MTDRRSFIAGFAVVIASVTGVGATRAAGRVYRIGWLREGESPLPKSFLDAMREYGWTEGVNVTVVAKYARRMGELPALARELARLPVDVLITDGSPATAAAKEATGTIPIAFSIAADPVARGFAASLARPGGNLTGFTFGEYDDKQLQVLKEALPSLTVVVYPRDPSAKIREAASVLGVTAKGIDVRGPDDLGRFFASAQAARADAVVFVNVAWAEPHEVRIAAEALKHRLPLIATWRTFAQSGAFLTYGPKPGPYGRSLAAQVDKILRGAKAGDLPVEQPTEFELVVNLKTARALGLTPPRSLLVRANDVIE